MDTPNTDFTFYDANWPDGDDIAQGSVVMKGDRCIEYRVQVVRAKSRKDALKLYEEAGGDNDFLHCGYELDPPAESPTIIVLHDKG